MKYILTHFGIDNKEAVEVELPMQLNKGDR